MRYDIRIGIKDCQRLTKKSKIDFKIDSGLKHEVQKIEDQRRLKR
jgi:hypothetical protein